MEDNKYVEQRKTMEKIVALCKNRGYVYQGSEIYGGLSNTWDYGPLGVEFKTMKKAWLKKFVQESPYNVGLDSAISNESAGLGCFRTRPAVSDPPMDCANVKHVTRQIN